MRYDPFLDGLGFDGEEFEPTHDELVMKAKWDLIGAIMDLLSLDVDVASFSLPDLIEIAQGIDALGEEQ